MSPTETQNGVIGGSAVNTSQPIEQPENPESEPRSAGLRAGVALLVGLAFIVGIFVVANAIINLVSGSVSSWNLPIGDTHVLSMLYSAVTAALTAVSGLFIASRLNMPLKELLFGVFNPANTYRYFAGGIIGAVVLLAINVMTYRLGMPIESTGSFVAPYLVMNLPTLLASLGFTVALAPIAEELLFRGFLLSLVRNSSFGLKVAMVVLSSFGFMLYHVAGTFLAAYQTSVSAGDFSILTAALAGSVPMLALYFFSGVALCVLTLKTQNIYASWIAHATYNLALLYGANAFILSALPH
jgi:membrane protein